MSLNESIVESAALEWFGELGYQVGSGPQMAPGEPAAERESFGEVEQFRCAPSLIPTFSQGEKEKREAISSRPSITSPALMERMGFDERKAQRVLRKLQDARLLRRVGRGPATHYEAVTA